MSTLAFIIEKQNQRKAKLPDGHVLCYECKGYHSVGCRNCQGIGSYPRRAPKAWGKSEADRVREQVGKLVQKYGYEAVRQGLIWYQS